MVSQKIGIVNLTGKILLVLFQTVPVRSFYRQADWYYRPYLPKIEFEHAPEMYTTERSREILGSDLWVKDPIATPDFRIEEPPYTRYYDKTFFEEERPYRVSPHYKQIYRFSLPHLWMVGCACCTVYKRFRPLSTCAVVTTRHILTTATATEVILRRYRHFKYLQDILGFYYDTDANVYNSTMYMSVARIHYHPKYVRPKMVNRSHPFPTVFDLAVWASTYRLYATWFGPRAVICPRAGSHRWEHSVCTPSHSWWWELMSITCGYQFMKAFKRVPMPWYKYMIQTKKHVIPCPKVEWGWFHCLRGNWAKLGLDSGAPLFRLMRNGWRHSGLMGMNVVSMKLRSLDMIHYYQVLDSHPVLDFMYAACVGKQKFEWLDARFKDSKGRSPEPLSDKLVYANDYKYGWDRYYGNIPNY